MASLFMTLTISHNFKIIRINTRNMIVNYSSINYFGKPLHLLCNTKRWQTTNRILFFVIIKRCRHIPGIWISDSIEYLLGMDYLQMYERIC